MLGDRGILVFMASEPGHMKTYLNSINENVSAVSTQLIAITPAFSTYIMQNTLIFQSCIIRNTHLRFSTLQSLL